MVTNFDSYIKEMIDDQKYTFKHFSISFMLSKIKAKNLFSINANIKVNNDGSIYKTNEIIEYREKIKSLLTETIFKNRQLYKNSKTEYIFNRKEIAYFMYSLMKLSFHITTPFGRIKLEDFLYSQYIKINVYNLNKSYYKILDLKKDFENFNFNDIDDIVNNDLLINNKLYFNPLFKVMMNDEIKQKYSYLNNAKNFDLI